MRMKLWSLVLAFLLLLVPTATMQAQDIENNDIQIELQFAATIGEMAASCGQTYENVGAGESAMELSDYRFYVYDIHLTDADGDATPLTLEQDGLWQFENIALMDFEDGTGRCEFGTAAMNSTVSGTIAEGNYTGVTFKMGIPFEWNHGEPTAAPTPLNLPSLWWNWQLGYKFVRIDMLMTDAETSSWNIHLGSTGCTSPAAVVSPETECARPNIASYAFEEFDFATDVIVADLGALVDNIDLRENDPAPPGCQSGFDDPDCPMLFNNLGLSLESGTCTDDCVAQTFFRVATRDTVTIIEDVNMMPDQSEMDMEAEDHSAHEGHGDSEASEMNMGEHGDHGDDSMDMSDDQQ